MVPTTQEMDDAVPSALDQKEVFTSRCKWVCVVVDKPARQTLVGLSLKDKSTEWDPRITIESIDSKGLFVGTPLEVGDHVISVNNVRLVAVDSAKRLMEETVGHLSIVVATSYSSPPNLKMVTLVKPHPHALVGVSFMKRNGKICMRIDKDTLAERSNLCLGDVVVSINGSTDESKASDLIYEAAKYVTIIARPAPPDNTGGEFHALPKEKPSTGHPSSLRHVCRVLVSVLHALEMVIKCFGDCTVCICESLGPCESDDYYGHNGGGGGSGGGDGGWNGGDGGGDGE